MEGDPMVGAWILIANAFLLCWLAIHDSRPATHRARKAFGVSLMIALLYLYAGSLIWGVIR
jgi:F0F1-type ATP synthase membrane subunit a